VNYILKPFIGLHFLIFDKQIVIRFFKSNLRWKTLCSTL